MAEGLKIEIFRMKNAEEFTASLADPQCRMETGSGAAMTAAVSAALLCRASRLAAEAQPDSDRAGYLARNTETLRKYMVHLIDEDVKARGPLRRALKEGGEREIEAARQPAIAICGEIINMMNQSLELAVELTGLCPKADMHYVGESAELALAAVKAARMYIVDLSDYCSDDTYRFVIRRENEITLEQCEKNAAAVREAAEKAI